VRKASARGIRTICIRPPAIWGNGGSSVISEIYRSVERTGAACYLGRGLNCYSNVHIDDLAALYALALERGRPEALYHAVSGELNFRVLAQAVARHLRVPVRSVTYGEARDIWGPSSTAIIFAASSRTRCPRARTELGWRPASERLDMFAECAHPAYSAPGRPRGTSWMAEPRP
jgi:nucleoside-diphosphate-sugar epimerase